MSHPYSGASVLNFHTGMMSAKLLITVSTFELQSRMVALLGTYINRTQGFSHGLDLICWVVFALLGRFVGGNLSAHSLDGGTTLRSSSLHRA